MVRRPTSITVIAVLQLVLGVLGVFSGVTSLIPRGAAAKARRAEWRATHPTPVPTPVQQAKSVLNTLIALVTGYYLLSGKNWSRILCLAWQSFQLLYGFAVWGAIRWSVISDLLMYGVIACFLFRPQANAFFAEGGAGLDEESRPSVRRLASIVFYVLSSIFFVASCLMAFMWSPLEVVKWLIICVQLLPAAVFLSVGRVLSPARFWAREVGIVLVASAALGAFGTTMFLSNPEWHKPIPPKNVDLFSDYTTGYLWIALMATFGPMWLLAAHRQATEKPVRAPIFGTMRHE